MGSYRLLTVDGNPKVVKGEKHGWLTGILHLAPSVVSLDHGGFNTCAWSDGCEAACLNLAGRGGIPAGQKREDRLLNSIQAARVRKTVEFLMDRDGFMVKLIVDIERLQDEAWTRGLNPAVRLNGTSDLLWDRIKYKDLSLMGRFEGLQFYDYTKRPVNLCEERPKNYHLTVSRGASWSTVHTAHVIEAGFNVAVVFTTRKGEALPKRYAGRRVIDGDLTDLRFKDPKGVVVGLRAKGPAKRETGTFVVDGGKVVPL